jgi:hypothetical protein
VGELTDSIADLLRHGRMACFYDIDANLRQEICDGKFDVGVKVDPRCLFTFPQRGIQDADHYSPQSSCSCGASTSTTGSRLRTSSALEHASHTTSSDSTVSFDKRTSASHTGHVGGGEVFMGRFLSLFTMRRRHVRGGSA